MSTPCPIDRWIRWFFFALVGLLIATCAHMAWGVSQWVQLSPPTSSRRFPIHYTDCTPSVTSGNPVGRSYSSMINGPSGKILYWGGGHGSHPGNDAELFNTATTTWTEQYIPECIDPCCRACSNDNTTFCVASTFAVDGCVSPNYCTSYTCGTGIGTCATGGTYSCSCEIMAGAGTTEITATSRPFTEHVFQDYAYNANPSRQHYLFSLTSGSWSYVPPNTWTRLNAAQVPLVNSAPWSSGKLMVYDPTVTCGSDTGAILLFQPNVISAGIYCYNYSTSSWNAFDTSGTAFPPGFGGIELTGTWDSARNEHIVSDGQVAIWRYKASTKTWTNTNAPAGALNTISSFFSTAVAYDAVDDFTLAAKPTGSTPDLWQYNNATGVWSDIDDTQLGTRPSNVDAAKWNMWRYDNGTFYLLSANSGNDGQGGVPDNPTYGTVMWSLSPANLPVVGTPTATPTITQTPTRTPTATSTPAVPLSWDQRAAQPGVLMAIGFHNATDVSNYGNVKPLTGVGPDYDAVVNAAHFPIINTLPATEFNYLDTYDWSGSLSMSLPWAQQFDANSEFEVQYLWRDDNWITEQTNKKISIWGAGDRNPSSPPVTGGPTQSGSCMPNDVVTEYYSRIGSLVHVPVFSGYQGCSSGPAWGESIAQQIGVDFTTLTPYHNAYWYQPAIPSCISPRIYNQNSYPGQVCTVIGANVWQSVTMHFILGPRGANPAYPATGSTDWFTNSYFWLAFGWEGHPSTPLIYRGPIYYYSPISDTSYGTPPPKIGKLWLFPYRQISFDRIGASSKTATTVAVTGSDITDVFLAGQAVTDLNTGYTTLTADVHPGDTTINVADASSLDISTPYVQVWRQMNSGNRWYKDVLIATGHSLADPFGIQPIAWPTPPNSGNDYPGLTPPPSGLVPAAPARGRPTPPHVVP